MRYWLWLIGISALLYTGTSQSGSSRSELPTLFQHVKATLPSWYELGQEVILYQPVTVNWEALQNAEPGTRIRLNFFPRRELIGRLVHLEKRDDQRYTWYGELEGVSEGGLFVLAVEVDALAGIFDAPSIYPTRVHIRGVENGIHLVCEIDPSKAPQCDGEPEGSPPEDNPPPDVRLPDDLPPPSDFSPAACTRPSPTVDLIVFYTTRARQQAGGVNAIRAQCKAGEAWTNQAYVNSQIPLTMRLVGAFETAYDEAGRSTITMLNHITNGSDGFIDEAHTFRNNYRADLVALWFHNGGGIAWCCADAGGGFSVSGWSGAGAGWLHAHETGHNLGGAHNVEDVDCGGCHTYSRGHRFIGTNGVRYITIMSYWTGDYATATMIQNFSNPNVTFAGVATGIANQRDNARTIREHSPTVEGFRLTRLDVWVDFGYGGPSYFGTFDFPYRLLNDGVNQIATVYDQEFVPFPILHIKAGSTSGSYTISRRMRIEACGGTVRIGAP